MLKNRAMAARESVGFTMYSVKSLLTEETERECLGEVGEWTDDGEEEEDREEEAADVS